METETIKISSTSLRTNLVINAVTLEERVERADPLLPYRNSRYDATSVLGGVFPWHWHDEVECFYMREGALIYGLQGEEMLFRQGDAGFLNANVLHMTKPPERDRCVQQNHIFLPELVCPEVDGPLAEKYLAPLLDNQRARIIRLEAGSAAAVEARELMDGAYAAAQEGAPGWEFAVRERMTKLWLLFLRNMPEGESAGDSADSGRLMRMLRYIAGHYEQKLTLRMVAEAAHISEKECERCFLRQIRMLPFAYLMDFRLDWARRALQTGDGSITDIAARCGFGSSSYFTKCFREKYRVTPRAYRNLARPGRVPEEPAGPEAGR